jgi:hypothetical protein
LQHAAIAREREPPDARRSILSRHSPDELWNGVDDSRWRRSRETIALISTRPHEQLTQLDHAKLVDKTLNRLTVWSRRHTADHTFHAILVRETVPFDNFHLLMHVYGNASLSLLRYALLCLARWFPEIGAAHVTRSDQYVGYTRSGKIKSALGYSTKECTPQTAWPKWQYLYHAYAKRLARIART